MRADNISQAKRSSALFKCTLLALVLSCLLLGCGRKSAIRPPEYFAPSGVRNLMATYDSTAVVLTWSPPLTQTGGRKLDNLASFRISRTEIPGFGEVEPDLAATEIGEVLYWGAAASAVYQFRDADVEQGHWYAYSVKAVNDKGKEGVAQLVRLEARVGRSLLPTTGAVANEIIPIAIRNFVFSGSRLGSYLEVAIEPTHSNTEVLRGLAIE